MTSSTTARSRAAVNASAMDRASAGPAPAAPVSTVSTVSTPPSEAGRPASDLVGERAAAILALILDDEDYPRLESYSKLYVDCWATFTGYRSW